MKREPQTAKPGDKYTTHYPTFSVHEHEVVRVSDIHVYTIEPERGSFESSMTWEKFNEDIGKGYIKITA